MSSKNIRIRTRRGTFTFNDFISNDGERGDYHWDLIKRTFGNGKVNFFHTYGIREVYKDALLLISSMLRCLPNNVEISLFHYVRKGKNGYVTYYARITAPNLPTAHAWFKKDGSYGLVSAGDGFDFWDSFISNANRDFVQSIEFRNANIKAQGE